MLKSHPPALPWLQALASLTVVDIKVPIHEGVDVTVEDLLVVFVIVTASEVVNVEEFLLAA